MKYTIPKVDKISEELIDTLSSIELVIDDLNSRRDNGLDPKLEKQLKERIKIRHVYHSNAIEGSKLTLRETEVIINNLSAEDDDLTKSRGRIEAKDLNIAYDYLTKLASGNEPLSSLSLRQLHELILKNTKNTEAGMFRKVNVEIKAASHAPPEALHVEEHINKMFTWMNRNIHKYDPIIMGAILHHWITWIHPFSDGNGRVSRLFLNFFLLQKGYPEIIIKIDDRDNYYNSLESADNGDFEQLFQFIAQNIEKSVTIIESFINEADRKKDFLKSFQNLGSKLLDDQVQRHSYQYEVWKSAINSFKNMFKEIVDDIDLTLPTIEMNCTIFDDITIDQYLDILESRPVTNNWIFKLTMFDQNTNMRFTIPFFPTLLAKEKPLKLLGVEVYDKSDPKKMLKQKYNRNVILSSSIKAGKQANYNYLSNEIDFVSVTVHEGNLKFGMRNKDKRYFIETVSLPPQDVITSLIRDLIHVYLGYKVRQGA